MTIENEIKKWPKKKLQITVMKEITKTLGRLMSDNKAMQKQHAREPANNNVVVLQYHNGYNDALLAVTKELNMLQKEMGL